MPQSRVYAVASGKGGVGKTTSAVNLGAAFVEAGRSTVVVDLDLGMANLGDVLDVAAPDATLHDVLAGDADVDDCPVPAPGGFDVVLGATDIESFGRADPKGLRGVLDVLRDRYDVVLLDTGGGLSYDTALPLGLADAVILVTTPDEAAINNTAKTSTLVDRIGGTLEGLLVTRIHGAGGGSADAVRASVDGRIVGSVPEDHAVPEAAAAGVPLLVKRRESPAAQSYREIAYDILDEPLPRDWASDGRDQGAATNQDDGPDEADDDSTAEPAPGSGPITTGDVAAAIESVEGSAGESTGAVDESSGSTAESADTEDESSDPSAASDTDSAVESEGESDAATESAAASASDEVAAAKTGTAPVADDPGTDDAPGDAELVDEAEDDRAESRSLLSRLTGGLFG